MAPVADVLRAKVTVDSESVDRVYRSGYVKDLQLPGGRVLVIGHQQGWEVPSPPMRYIMTDDVHAAVDRFAAQQGLAIVAVAKNTTKEEMAQAAVARCPGTEGVVRIGQAQDASTAFQGRRPDKGTTVWFTDSRCRVRVTPYSCSSDDADFGRCFIKGCSDLPCAVKVCCKGHEWAKQQLRREGMAVEAVENGFAWCADPARVHARCAQLTAATMQAFVDRWVDQRPWPLTAAERAAG